MYSVELDVLRHGECEGGRIFRGSTDVSLSDVGWQQMEKSVALANSAWDAIVTSPLQRCSAFATRLGGQLNIPVVVQPLIKEMNFGDWEGREVSEISARYPEVMTAWTTNPVKNFPPNSEPFQNFSQRIELALEQSLKQYQNKKILWVAHGGVMRVLLSHCVCGHFNQINTWHVPYGCLSRLAFYHTSEFRRWQMLAHNLAG